MDQDIFAAAEKEPDAFESITERPAPTTFTKKENYWDKQDITSADIDVTKFKKTGKSFAIYVHPENDIPADAATKIVTIARALMKNKYTFRHTGNKDNSMQNTIMGSDNVVAKSFLPWKKFNPNIKDPTLATPLGYQIAIGIHKAFMRLPSAVRAILSRDVSALLGVEATDPVDMIIVWTDGGDESIGRDADFKKIGNNTFILQVAKRANIPVFNVYNPDFIDRLQTVIK